MNETLVELVKFMKTASPAIWDTLIKQVYIDAWSFIIWACVFAVLCVTFAVFTVLLCMGYHETNDSDLVPLSIPCGVMFIVLGIIAFNFALNAVKHFLNPNFYAIQYILQNVVNK